jgi:hypothetical protein
VPFVIVIDGNAALRPDSSVVDHDVEPAEGLGDGVDRGGDLVARADVTPEAGQLARKITGVSGDGHCRTSCRQQLGRRKADS